MSPGALLALLPLLAGDPPAPGGVPLTFAWPSPLRCEIEHRTAVAFKDGDMPTGNTIALSLQAVRAGGGWLIRQKILSMHPDAAGPATAAKARKPDPHEAELVLYPPFTVSSEGVFGGLELTAGDRAILEKRQASQDRTAEMVRKLAPNAPQTREDILGTATKRAAAGWNLLVGAWAGKHLPEGENPGLRAERNETLPLIGPVHIVDRMKLTRGEPCKPSPKGGCVKLEITSSPPDATGTKDARYHLTTTLVTDPRTLVPRSLTRLTSVETPDPNAPKSGAAPVALRHTRVIETMTFRCKR